MERLQIVQNEAEGTGPVEVSQSDAKTRKPLFVIHQRKCQGPQLVEFGLLQHQSAPFARELARPGDVIAQQHGRIYAHVGIVVAPGRTVSAYGDTAPQGLVLENNWGFRTAPGANGESATDPPPVVRRSLQPTP